MPADAAATRAEFVRELHAQYYLPLVRLAIQLVDDLDTAEDVVQDVFAAVVNRDITGDPQHYLRTAVVNRARSALRRRRTVRGCRGRAPADVAAADASVLADERADRLWQLITELPSRQREVLALRYYEGLAVQEIATVLGTSAGSVSTALGRALTSLRAQIGDNRDDY